MSDIETITISKSEYNNLIELRDNLPKMLQKAREEEAQDALRRLHQRDKENPELARKRAIARYNLKKDEINAKRREAYRLKKAGNGSSTPEN